MVKNRKWNTIRLLLMIISLASISCIIQISLSIVMNPSYLNNVFNNIVDDHGGVANSMSSYVHNLQNNGQHCPQQLQYQQDHKHHNDTASSKFLSPNQYNKGWGDVYSGMFWVSINYNQEPLFQAINYTKVKYLEQVSFFTFRRAKHVLQTKDWLDLNVEHLSKYIKHFLHLLPKEQSSDNGKSSDANSLSMDMLDRVEEILLHYIASRIEDNSHHCHNSTPSAISSTIAILPIHTSSPNNNNTINEIGSTSELGGNKTSSYYKSRMQMLQLATAIASLWNVGFPRVVVAGVDNTERAIAQQAFHLLKDHLEIRFMELTYVAMNEHAENEKEEVDVTLIPKVAMIQFQNSLEEYQTIMRNNNANTTTAAEYTTGRKNILVDSWLGSNPSRYKYLYFSEPDLILNIRPQAVPYLSNELEKGGNLLNAHRLQPLPHMQQFMDIHELYLNNHTASNDNKTSSSIMESKLLPHLASFAGIHDLDTTGDDTCHDQGKFYPANKQSSNNPLPVRKEVEGCYTQWAFCGFSSTKPGLNNYSDWSTVLEKHRLLVTYPFISLRRGTGLPLVHHGQRVCIPKRGSMMLASQ